MSCDSIFEQASRIFPVTPDPDTGLRLLYTTPLNPGVFSNASDKGLWSTPYHQNQCFTSEGTQVLLNYLGNPGDIRAGERSQQILDLTTGQAFNPFPVRHAVLELSRSKPLAFLARRDEVDVVVSCLWDIPRNREVAAFRLPDWTFWGGHFLADGQSVVLGFYRGAYYKERCHSRFFLLRADGTTKEVLNLAGCFCNHIQGCPSDPGLYSYNRWPTPQRPCEVVHHIREVNGAFDFELPQVSGVVRPGSIWGGQRDHYLWTPDGRRIASYFSPLVSDSQDHFDYGWWVSVMDWRTGEDLAAPYPVDRWAGHFAVSPDSRFLVAVGHRSFQKVFAIDIERLRAGWNERTLCACPPSVVRNDNQGPFHMPFFLPDQSGVIFTAGWAGSKQGIYIVELPDDMRSAGSTGPS